MTEPVLKSPEAALPRGGLTLRTRLGLVLTLVFGVILGVSTAVVIHKARGAVAQEVRSTANLALQLLEMALGDLEGREAGADAAGAEERFTRHIAELARTRHLRIELSGADGRVLAPPLATPGERDPAAPGWFVRLVQPDALELRRALDLPGLPAGEVVVRADPADEIEEAWQEAWPLLGLLASCLGLSILAVFFAVDRSLRPIEAIERALARIEGGDYATRVPRLGLPELDRIGRKVDHMSRVLEQAREDNRALVKRGLAIQEAERRYLAQELHDEMGQSISAIKAVAVSMGKRLAGVDGDLGASARTIVEASSRMYEAVRGMMRRLRPAALDELGLAPALENMVDDWNAHHEDVFCSLSLVALPRSLPDEVEIGLYRIVQECLTNVARHAAASRVDVRLTLEQPPGGGGPQVVLEVQDDGIGLPEPAPARGFGLRGIRERVESLRGGFELANAGGARLRVTLPACLEAAQG